jgi:hypothetical protein
LCRSPCCLMVNRIDFNENNIRWARRQTLPNGMVAPGSADWNQLRLAVRYAIGP